MELNIIIQNFIEQYGLISIFLIVMLEYANIPLPSEVVLPFVGIMVAKGNINFASAVIVSVIAGLVGSIINYYIGYYFGKPIINLLVSKYPKTEKSAKASYVWLQKYDKLSVMLTRVVPLARTFISIPAGITKMNIYIFTIYSGIGILLWNLLLISIGFFVGDNLKTILVILNNYTMSVGVIIVILFIGYLFMKRKNN